MDAKDLLLIGAVGVGAWFLATRSGVFASAPPQVRIDSAGISPRAEQSGGWVGDAINIFDTAVGAIERLDKVFGSSSGKTGGGLEGAM